MSPDIDNDDKNKRRTEVRFILCSKEYVQNNEVKDYFIKNLKTFIPIEVTDSLFALMANSWYFETYEF